MNEKFKYIAKNYFISECMQNGVCDENDLAEIIKYGYNLALENVKKEVERIRGVVHDYATTNAEMHIGACLALDNIKTFIEKQEV